MIQTTIRLLNRGQATQAVAEYGRGVVLLLSQFAWRTLDDAKTVLEVYPAVPSRIRVFVAERIGARGKRYVKTSAGPKRADGRTGQLGASWKLVAAGNDGWKLSNDAARRGRPYPAFVHGDATGQGQAWMHVGRWKLMRPVVDQAQRQSMAGLKVALASLARERGLAR